MRLHTTPEVFIGQTSIHRVSHIVEELQSKNIMIVTNEGIVKSGIYENLRQVLKFLNSKILIFDRVVKEPTVAIIKDAVEKARKSGVDTIFAIGGGSPIDSAKIISLLIRSEKEDIESEIFSIDSIKSEKIPVIAIPTTAGSGAESNSMASVFDEKSGIMRSVESGKLLPEYVILDSLLTVDLPEKPTIYSGIDAMIHGIEAYLSEDSNFYSDIMALEAVNSIKYQYF